MDPLSLPNRLKAILRRLVNGHKIEHRLRQRGQIILLLAKFAAMH